MRPLMDMDTIQIEITNACHINCSNCTRFCGHHRKPYMMEMSLFKRCVDSMVEYPRMTGVMGGEPLLHPNFEEMCDYLHSKIEPDRCGLWTSLPPGKEQYREAICRTFGHVFINDHSRPDIWHVPVLVAAEEVMGDKDLMWYLIDHCWIQNCWSACMNPHGAWFCEIAGSMSMLFNAGKDRGWPIEPGWWKRTPKDFVKQMEFFCPKCGGAMPLFQRPSVDGVDDISPRNLERLKGYSPKIKAGKYKVYDRGLGTYQVKMAAYKDMDYRNAIAARYGMFLSINSKGFCSPFLFDEWHKEE